MQIHDYCTASGKNVIKEYLSNLPEDERVQGYGIRHKLVLYGVDVLNELTTRQLRGKLWEIKFAKNNIYFMHACRKQKGKAERFELEKALQRAKEEGFIL